MVRNNAHCAGLVKAEGGLLALKKKKENIMYLAIRVHCRNFFFQTTGLNCQYIYRFSKKKKRRRLLKEAKVSCGMPFITG